MINWFKVCEIHLSLAGHFVWWTSSPSLDILTSHWTFHCKIVPEYQTFCSTFWTISRTFSCPWFTLPGQFVRRDQTHSPDICQNRPDMSGESGEFHVLWIISILIIFISCKHLCFNAPIYVSQCPHVCFQYVCVSVLLLVVGYGEAGQNFPPEAQYLTMQTFRTINPDIVSTL